MKLEEIRIEQILTTDYGDQIKMEQNPLMINHGLLDIRYPELAEELITHYKPTKQTITRIVNDLTLHDTNLEVEFYNIQNKQPIHEIHSQQQGTLVEIHGKIIKATTVYPQITIAAYTCPQCGNISKEVVGYDSKINKNKKQSCILCNRTSSHEFNKFESTFDDVQILTVQENRDDAIDGHRPSEIKCILTNEQVDTVTSGDAVILNGIVELRNTNAKNMFQEYLLVDHIQRENEDYAEIKLSREDVEEIIEASQDKDIINKLKKSIAPSIYGCEEIKEAILLQLVGSDSMKIQNSTKRGDIHILLVGDAGLGKSQILKFVSELAPRGIYTSGKSSSGAGLTATATQDANGIWTLESGAMVLADKGFLCIDELDKMSETDRSSIHEALEQQTISVAKAGMTTTLDSRCSVLAAANPKFGSFNLYDAKLSLSQQINLSDTLQSRFDLIFIMIDSIDDDEELIESIFEEADDECDFSPEFLRKYISYAKKEIHPVFDKDAQVMIQRFYKKWRKHQIETGAGTKVTRRQLDALRRLALASARVRLSEHVMPEDAERAIRLEQYCIDQYEYQISLENVEHVGYYEDIHDPKTHDKMCHEIKLLAKDYENKIPARTIQRKFNELNFSKNFVERWLRAMDSQELMLCDVTTDEWSCIGEWYED